MTLNELENKRKRAESKIAVITEWLSDIILNDDQKTALEDLKWNILGSYDAEISFQKNMIRIEEFKAKYECCSMANTNKIINN